MKWVIKHRTVVILFLLALSVLLGKNIKHLTKEAGVSSLLSEDNPDYLYFKETEDIFGATDQIVVGITVEDTVYTIEHIRLINEISMFLESLEEIEDDEVVSLTTIDDMEGSEGELLIDPLVKDIDLLDVSELNSLRERVRSNPLFNEKLVSRDERSAVVIGNVSTDITLDDEKLALLKKKVEEGLGKIGEAFPASEIDLSGMPITKALISEYMSRDISRLFPLAVIVVVIMLYVLIRRLFGMIVPVLVTLFSIVWTFGLKALLRSPITIAETSIPIMLIAIGCADGVHIASEFFSLLKKGWRVREAILESMRILTIPVIMTSVTTSLGFASLLTAPGVSIKNMGIFLTFGVMVAMLFSLFFIPAFLSLYKPKKLTGDGYPEQDDSSRFNAFMRKFGGSVIKRRKVIFTVALLVLSVSALGILNIEVESDELKYFKKDNPFRIATEKIEKALGGIVSLDVIIEGTKPGTIKQPRILQAMKSLQDYCEEQELVSYSISAADYIERINYVLHDNDSEYERIPKERETVYYETEEEIDGQFVTVTKQEEVRGADQIAQFLLLYELGGGENLDRLVDNDYQKARINVRLRDTSNRKLALLIDKLKAYREQNIQEDVEVKFSNHYLRLTMTMLIIKGQIRSLLIVLAAIFLLLTLLFRSPGVGLITATPILIAVLFNFAVMWIFGITLNVGTSVIASVGMGVGVDYAIHYFSRFKLLLGKHRDYETAIVHAVGETSKAILSNAAAVGTGFMVLLLSNYHVVASIGWITALSMFTTAGSSLTVLPAMLLIFRPKVRRAGENA